MPSELSLAIQQICDEKNLPMDAVKETIESALKSAYRKDFGNKLQNLKVDFNMESGEFEVFDVKEVVEDELKKEYDELRERLESMSEEERQAEMEKIEALRHPPTPLRTDLNTKTRKHKDTEGDEAIEDREGGESIQAEIEEEKKFNPKTMISLTDAKEEKKSIKIGDDLVHKLEVPAEFGRMAAQTAKQVIIQKIREAERDSVYNLFKDKQGDLITGTIQRREGRVILVDLGETTAIVPPPDQIEKENYKPGARMKFYLKSVEQTAKGPEVVISRTHPEMVRKLFKLEVPEINQGTVQIKSIAREAGSRSKVAVWAKDQSLDPIGACIGQRGTRVQTIINELGGEKIDIIEWDENPEVFITKALAPAKIVNVELDEKNKVAKAYVKEDQYSLAIGKQGQNVRLAARLTGWRIDIVQQGGIEKQETRDKKLEAGSEKQETEKPETEEQKTEELKIEEKEK